MRPRSRCCVLAKPPLTRWTQARASVTAAQLWHLQPQPRCYFGCWCAGAACLGWVGAAGEHDQEKDTVTHTHTHKATHPDRRCLLSAGSRLAEPSRACRLRQRAASPAGRRRQGLLLVRQWSWATAGCRRCCRCRAAAEICYARMGGSGAGKKEGRRWAGGRVGKGRGAPHHTHINTGCKPHSSGVAVSR